MTNNPVKPHDILPDGVEATVMNGRTIRKGTVAAFLANIDILENINATEKAKQAAIQAMQELAPDIVAIGVRKHVIFRNPEVERIFTDLDQSRTR